MTSREYALALYESVDKTKRTEMIEWFHLIEGIVESTPDYVRLMRSPNVSDAVKKKLLSEVFVDAPQTFLHFLYVVIDQDRFGEILDISHDFQSMMHDEDQVMVVDVITARPVDLSQRQTLTQALENTYQKTIVLQERLESDVIGGIRLEFQGKVLDQSVKAQVQRLQQSLRKGS
jgi:F-type H+-transporting ATPase subunit delta